MRPETVEETLSEIFDAVHHSAQVQIEAWGTNDDEDENGKRIDPIHDYAESQVRMVMPIAVLGCFLLLFRSSRDSIKKDLEA